MDHSMGVNKTISLDAQTAMIAERMPNFSQFVRNSLRKHARMEMKKALPEHIAPEPARNWGDQKDKCNPRHMKGRCFVCWGDE